MKLTALIGAAPLLGCLLGGAANAGTHGAIQGDYVEARTASVFAGACHFGGEVTTTGRQAEMAWHVRTGAWNGVKLDGLNALAAVAADQNLRDESVARHSVIYVDAKATPSQAEALADALQTSYARSLGRVVAVKRAPIVFQRNGETYHVAAAGVTTLDVDAMPNHACCKQPNLVWYSPLAPVANRRVGYTRTSGIRDASLGAPWKYEGQNTAFYGAFNL